MAFDRLAEFAVEHREGLRLGGTAAMIGAFPLSVSNELLTGVGNIQVETFLIACGGIVSLFLGKLGDELAAEREGGTGQQGSDTIQ